MSIAHASHAEGCGGHAAVHENAFGCGGPRFRQLHPLFVRTFVKIGMADQFDASGNRRTESCWNVC